MDFIEDLRWREALKQVTDEDGLRKAMSEGKIGAYVGTDPTGDSLHVGHLIPFMILKRFQMTGQKAVIIIGAGTGAIGDPSGKKSERQLLSIDQLNKNTEALTKQITKLFGDNDTVIINNNDWLGKISLQEFLRDYGKLFSVNVMIKKDIVANRLESGISYTEFTYQILQALDFHELWKKENVRLQIGGSDQWGNIVSGVDLIHSLEGSDAEAFGLTIPLMLNSDGTKFGKSEGNAIYLDKEKTSVYEFYQFWLNQADADAIKYLKYFTFLDKEEIEELEQKLKEAPEKREAQRTLAREVTKFVHGEEAVEEAETITKALFSGDVKELSAKQIAEAFAAVPSFDINAGSHNIIDVLIESGVEKSKRQAREDVTNGAIHINGERITDLDFVVNTADNYDGKYVLIRRGKKKYFLGRVQ